MLISPILQTRENFKSSRDDIQALMRKMLEVRQTVRRFILISLDCQRSNAEKTIRRVNNVCCVGEPCPRQHYIT